MAWGRLRRIQGRARRAEQHFVDALQLAEELELPFEERYLRAQLKPLG
jgi:hypothetical protein